MKRFLAVMVVAAAWMLAGCARQTTTTAAPPLTICDPAARRDVRYILGTTAQPQHHLTKPWQVDYIVQAPTGLAYFNYTVSGRKCILSHVDARWEHRALPLIFHLRGGNLRSVGLVRDGDRGRLVVVDRWGRTFAKTFGPLFPAGLTLWGDSSTGPLHAAVGGRWQSEAGPDIYVGRNGPELFYSDERTTPPPSEWDAGHNAFVQRVSVYTP